MKLFRNIYYILLNLSILLYYGFRKIAIYVEQYILEWQEYIDEPRYIQRGYDDPIDYTAYQKNERNRYGFPRQTKGID